MAYDTMNNKPLYNTQAATPAPDKPSYGHLTPKPVNGKPAGLSVPVVGIAQQPDPTRINAYLRYLNQGATPLAGEGLTSA
jgi:hypothetical protein